MSLPLLLMVWCQNGVVVVVDDTSVAKMSGGDVDVELYLNSQNTSRTCFRNQILKAKWDKIVGVGRGMRWWCMWYMVVLCRSGGGMRKCMWAPEQNLAKYGRKTGGGEEVMLPGAGCPGCRAGCPGSGSVDGFEDPREERSNLGKIRRNLWMEIGEKWMES